MMDRTADGRAFRMLTIVDEFTRECLAIDVARKLTSEDVLERLSDLFVRRGVPEHIRSDNGSEFTAKRVREWLERVEVVLDFHPASLAINQPCHGCGPETRNLLPLSAVMQPRHHPESAGRSDFGCRGNTQGLRTRRRASGEETTPQSRRATAPPRSRRRRPGHGPACPQFEVSPRRCLGSLRCGIFQKQWP